MVDTFGFMQQGCYNILQCIKTNDKNMYLSYHLYNITNYNTCNWAKFYKCLTSHLKKKMILLIDSIKTLVYLYEKIKN